MMQMLHAGGLQVLSDNQREADEDNPRGYFELAKVKQIKQDASWLDDAEGKGFKMVSMLLYDLPPDRDYKIVFMTRDMSEILASQARMLERLGKDGGPDDSAMRSYFESHLAQVREWLGGRENIPSLFCNYNELMQDPEAAVTRVAAFLDMGLNRDKMLQAVDPDLYRNRLAAEKEAVSS